MDPVTRPLGSVARPWRAEPWSPPEILRSQSSILPTLYDIRQDLYSARTYAPAAQRPSATDMNSSKSTVLFGLSDFLLCLSSIVRLTHSLSKHRKNHDRP